MLNVTPLPDRLTSKIAIEMATDCWEWTATRNSSGYGSVWWDGRMLSAHRVIYEMLVGPVPDGMQLDHLCRVRHCVNPAHLEPVSNRENCLRGEHRNVIAHLAGVCVSGRHEMTGSNVYRYEHGEQCRACQVELKRQWRRRASKRVAVQTAINDQETA